MTIGELAGNPDSRGIPRLSNTEIHQMTDSPIEALDLLDTDYTDILANSSLPSHIPHPLLSQSVFYKFL